MATRSLDQIISELGSVYDPQVGNLRGRQALIPGQVAEEEKGLQAKQTQSFDDILAASRRRGMGFSGIPISEQARYTSTEFLPALARLRQQGKEQAMSLEDAILGLNERRRTQAQSIYQDERNFEEQQRQFNEQMQYQRAQQAAAERAARAAAGGGFSFGGGGGGGAVDGRPSLDSLAGIGGNPRMMKSANGGFAFKDGNGNPISAAKYAQITGFSFRSLLQKMANGGDGGAKFALGFVGDDFGADQRKIKNNKQAQALYRSLVWGVK